MADIKFVELKCQRCGGGLEEKGSAYVCTSCGKKWLKETMHDFTDMLEACEQAIQSQRIEDIAHLRQLLWKETHNEYVSNIKVLEYCTDILKYLPQDFYANFYFATCSKNKTELNEFLTAVNIEEHTDDIPLVLDYLLKSLKSEWAMGISIFIEKLKDIDTALYHKYRTWFDEEYQKTEDDVFEPALDRDVFIAYSSADMPKVMELVSVLEEEELSCFVAARNMRHGSGSVENYSSLLHTAINHCQVFVFVSSNNSRSLKCDAYREEISYIIEHRKNMPRVEYLIQNYCGRSSERNFKNFFNGLEYCLSPKDVLDRVTDILMSADSSADSNKDEIENKNRELQQQIEEERRRFEEERQRFEQARKEEEEKKLREEQAKKAEQERKKLDEEKRRENDRLNAEQAYQTGLNYYYGQNGVAQNYEEAVKWYRKAAEQGNELAQCNLGIIYYQGQGVTQNYEEAVKWFFKSAEQGYSNAQNWLGCCYERGQGISKNITEAVKWYKKAAEQGNADAQCNLGFCYEKGYGVTQSYTEAVKWYRKSADQGSEYAQNNLGLCYYNGKGVKQNYEEAVKWFFKSAEQGFSSAQSWLGYCYECGQGVNKNINEAVKWYRKAAEQGNADAQCNLGLCYYNGKGVKQNYEEAINLYRKSAEQGHSGAQHELGISYDFAHGVEKNYREAAKWYKKSAQQGNADSQFRIGYFYQYYDFGEGTPPNYTEAIKWYRKAAEQGNQYAKDALKRLGN